MADEQALLEQAMAAANDIIDKYLADRDAPMRQALAGLLALAWADGRSAGGSEATAIIRRSLGATD